MESQFSHLLFQMQQKKELKSCFLLGVALSGVCVYQVLPPPQL